MNPQRTIKISPKQAIDVGTKTNDLDELKKHDQNWRGTDGQKSVLEGFNGNSTAVARVMKVVQPETIKNLQNTQHPQ